MDHKYSIRYKNILLLPMTMGDSERYRELRNLDEIRCWFETTKLISEEDQKRWFFSYIEKKNDLMFSIYNDNDVYVGGCSLYRLDMESAEFGRLVIDPMYQGCGYGKNATKAATEIAKSIGLHSIHLDVFEENHAAIKIYSSVGFNMTGERFFVNNKPMRSMEIKF